MGDISYPNTISVGTVVSEDVRENLFVPKSTPDSLAVIDGFLDEDNLASAVSSEIPKGLVRRGSFTRPETTGSTLNLDYFREPFDGSWTMSWDAAQERALAIPGCTRRFNIPWDDCKAVYISFRLEVVVDAGYGFDVGNGDYYDTRDNSGTLLDDGSFTGGTYGVNSDYPGETRLMLFYDGEPVKGVSRIIQNGVQGVAKPFNYSGTVDNPNDPMFSAVRHWSGSAIIDPNGPFGSGSYQLSASAADQLAKGFHNVSIRIAHQVYQVRVRTRHITVIPLR